MQDNNEGQIVLYHTEDGQVAVDVLFRGENFWLTQKAIGNLFTSERSVVTKHLNNIFKTGELDKNSVCAKFAHTAADNKIYSTNFYSLEAVIAVGYRVNSEKAIRFRQWATNALHDLITKGYVLDEELLKNGRRFGRDYFDDLVEKISEIRASERRFYQKVTDIYSQCSYDYDKDSPTTRLFFKTVQNKLHFSITGKTAPEIVISRADSEKPHMGLTTWKHAPEGKILKSDVSIAKNYLDHAEMSHLNEIVTMYLMFAENQARRHQLMGMDDWVKRLDAFLQFNEYDILTDAGKVTAEVAKATAEAEYEKFRVYQDQEFISDFDREVQLLLDGQDGRQDPSEK